MITVHDRTATKFTTTGLAVLDREIIDPLVTEELGGEYSLTFTYPADAPAAHLLTLEAIIACPLPGAAMRQGFRIHEVTTTLDGLLEVTCFHLFYDLAANLVADTFVVNKTAKAALDQLLGAANTPHRFTATSSDSTTRASARVVRMPLAAAIMDTDEDNTFASRWGGEITRDNWHIHHAPRRGQDRGVVIRDRKNLTGYESALDFTTVVTRILPVGYDGLLLPELYVDSPKRDDYVTPRIRVMRYSGVKAIKDPDNPREGELPLDQAYAELRRLAALEYSKNHVDEPSASYKVSFVDLATTVEYTDLAELETVLLGDTVTVRHTDLNVALSARVVSYDYDPLREAYLSVDLGSVAGKFTTVTRQVKTAMTTAIQAEDVAGFALASADGKNTNHYGTTQPTNARLGDTWFKQNGEQVEIWIYQLTDTGTPDWVALATDLNHAQVQAELDAARAEVDQALAAAQDAQTAADQVALRLTTAQADIDEAKAAAAGAQAKADEATATATQIDARLTEATLELDQTRTQVAGIGSQLDAAQTQLDQTRTDLEGLRTDVETGLDTATSAAQAAHNAAAAAQADADQAIADAAAAAGLAGGKADVLIQTTTPPAGMRKTSTLWIDTTGGANTPKRWNGTSWVTVTDKTARDAATVAANAVTAAQTAQSRADAAYQLAESKPSTTQVQNMVTTSANGKNTITLSTAAPSGSGKRPGDTWWRITGAAIIGQWQWDGTKWLATAISHQVISSVDVNTLTVTGTARMSQAVVDKIVGGAAHFRLLTADKLLVGSASNLIPNGDLAYGQPPWSTSLTRNADSPPPGYSAYLTTSKGAGSIANPGGGVLMPVTPGATYAFEVWVKADLPDSKFYLELRNQSGAHAGQAGQVVNNGDTYTGGGAYLVQARAAPKVWTRFSCQYTMNESTTQVRLGTFYFNHSTGTERNAQVFLGGFRLRPMTSAVLIENGAITASKIAADAITAAKIKAGAVTSDKLTISDGFITNAMIANAAISDAKISSLSAAKITSGYLAAARIQTGSITSDKLTIANGFIKTAMIKDAAISDAKISSLSAAKITSGYLAAARIAAGSITSDKLTIANGFITTVMIKDAAVTSAKIAALDAGKITTGTLSAARIGAKSITADKLATNAIQVGLAGWTQSIRISPTQISWYDGSTLEGTISSSGMKFWYGTRYIGEMARRAHKDKPDVQGIVNQVAYRGDYVAWTYQTISGGDYFTCLTLDPKGRFYGKAGIHLGADLRTNGYKFYTTDSRYITLQDVTLSGKGTYAGWASSNGLAKIAFHTYDLMVVTNGSYYNMTRLFDRTRDLMSRVNSLIQLFNHGWITSISGSGSNITWQYYSNTGLSTMNTGLV